MRGDESYILHTLLSTLPYQGFSVTGCIRADRGRLWAYKWRFKQPLLVHIMICHLTYVPNPPCQLSLWEETGVPGENPRLSAERWLCSFHMRTGFESLEPAASEVKGKCANHLATEAPYKSWRWSASERTLINSRPRLTEASRQPDDGKILQWWCPNRNMWKCSTAQTIARVSRSVWE
jgi:hypothetical protein